jgi:hypothetical protein
MLIMASNICMHSCMQQMHFCMQQMHLYSEYTMQLVLLEAWRDVLTTQQQGNNASPPI